MRTRFNCSLYIVLEMIANITNDNLNTDYQIFIIFGLIFRHNWPSNDRSSSHLTQRLLLHYLRKAGQTKYYNFYLRLLIYYLIKISHVAHFVHISVALADSLSTINVRNVGPSREHRHADTFSIR